MYSPKSELGEIYEANPPPLQIYPMYLSIFTITLLCELSENEQFALNLLFKYTHLPKVCALPFP